MIPLNKFSTISPKTITTELPKLNWSHQSAKWQIVDRQLSPDGVLRIRTLEARSLHLVSVFRKMVYNYRTLKFNTPWEDASFVMRTRYGMDWQQQESTRFSGNGV